MEVLIYLFTKELNMNIGKNLIELREGQKLSVDFVAQQLGITVEEYKAIENDRVDITLSRLEAIGKILSVSPVELLVLNEPVGGIKNFFFNQNGNTGVNINIQGVDQEEIRKAYKELYLEELKRVPKLEKLLRDNNIDVNF